MADSTETSTAVKSVSVRDIHAGTYAVVVSHTLTTTPSASVCFLMMPLQRGVKVLDGYVSTSGDDSFSWDLMVGWGYDKSFFVAPVEVISPIRLGFTKNLPHTVTVTASIFPRTKPLAVTVALAVSGTLGATPIITLMALLQTEY